MAEDHSQYMFSALELKKSEQLRHIFGVSTGFTYNGRPIARAEILVACPKGKEFERGTVRMEFESPEFKKEDIALQGLLSWLMGKYNRYVKMPLTPNGFNKDRQIEDFVNIHFYAACHLASKGETEKSIKNLYQAYLHGFTDLAMLDKEIIQGGSLHPLLASELLVKPDDPKENDMSALNAIQIITKIRQQAKHQDQIG